MSFFLLVHSPAISRPSGSPSHSSASSTPQELLLALALPPRPGRILDLTNRRTVLLVAGLLNAVVVLALAFTTVWGPLLWGALPRATGGPDRPLHHDAHLRGGFDACRASHPGLGPVRPLRAPSPSPSGVSPATWPSRHSAIRLCSSSPRRPASPHGSWCGVCPLLPILGHRPRRGFWSALAQRNLLPLWWVTLTFAIGMETIFTFTQDLCRRSGRRLRRVSSSACTALTAAATRILGGRHYDRIPQRPSRHRWPCWPTDRALLLLAVAGKPRIIVVAAIAAGLAHGVRLPHPHQPGGAAGRGPPSEDRRCRSSPRSSTSPFSPRPRRWAA